MLIDLSNTWPWVTRHKAKGMQLVIARPSMSQDFCDGLVRRFSHAERLSGSIPHPLSSSSLDGGRMATVIEPHLTEQVWQVYSWSLEFDKPVVYHIEIIPGYVGKLLVVKVSVPFLVRELNRHPPMWHDAWSPGEEGCWGPPVPRRSVYEILASEDDWSPV